MLEKKRLARIKRIFEVALLCLPIAGAVHAQDYPVRSVRMVVPFAPGGTSGLVSRRPARGEDVVSAGFYRVAVVTSELYPSRTVRMVVPFAPGGASDIVGRIMAPKLSQEFGQQIVIDNRAGASGNIGVEVAAHANPDGYTFLLGNVGTMAINPSIFPKFPVRPLRDFIAVTEVVDVPGALAVHPAVAASTVRDFVDYAKASRGKLNFGSSGAGSAQRMEMEIFMRAAGIDLVHIPYKGGAGAATTALVSGEVSVAVVSLAAVLPHIKSGRIKALGVISPKRFALLPDTPTMTESGYPTIRNGSWQGVYFPLGTPRAMVNKLYQAVLRVVADPDVVRRLNEAGAEIVTSKSPEDFAQFMQVQNERFAKVIREVGVVTE